MRLPELRQRVEDSLEGMEQWDSKLKNGEVLTALDMKCRQEEGLGETVMLLGNCEHKDDLKAMGTRWAPKKHLWYKSPKSLKRRHRGEFTMDEIRSRYGSQSVRRPMAKALAS